MRTRITEEKIANVTNALTAIHKNIETNNGKPDFLKVLLDHGLSKNFGTHAIDAGIFYKKGKGVYGNNYAAIQPILAIKVLMKASRKFKKYRDSVKKHSAVSRTRPSKQNDMVKIIITLIRQLSVEEKNQVVKTILNL